MVRDKSTAQNQPDLTRPSQQLPAQEQDPGCFRTDKVSRDLGVRVEATASLGLRPQHIPSDRPGGSGDLRDPSALCPAGSRVWLEEARVPPRPQTLEPMPGSPRRSSPGMIPVPGAPTLWAVVSPPVQEAGCRLHEGQVAALKLPDCYCREGQGRHHTQSLFFLLSWGWGQGWGPSGWRPVFSLVPAPSPVSLGPRAPQSPHCLHPVGSPWCHSGSLTSFPLIGKRVYVCGFDGHRACEACAALVVLAGIATLRLEEEH